LSVHPLQPNTIIACDLRHEPVDWTDASPEEIRRRVFTRQVELGDEPRIPLIEIHLNRSPAIAPVGTIDDERAAALGIDISACSERAKVLRNAPGIIQKIRSVYADPPRRSYEDPELQIYSGDFFPDEDRDEFEFIRTSGPDELKSYQPRLYDARGPELLWRYIARNFPETLSEDEKQRWKSFCATRILTPEPENKIDFGRFQREVKNRFSRVDTPAKDKRVLKSLIDYADYIERTVLT
jgi:exodeoxyribonuclease-1